MKQAIIFIHSIPFTKGMLKEEKKQEVFCKIKAKKLGYEVKKTFLENTNAFQINSRPYLVEALKYCKNKENNITSFIALDKNKISRNINEFLNIENILKAYGIEIITVY